MRAMWCFIGVVVAIGSASPGVAASCSTWEVTATVDYQVASGVADVRGIGTLEVTVPCQGDNGSLMTIVADLKWWPTNDSTCSGSYSGNAQDGYNAAVLGSQPKSVTAISPPGAPTQSGCGSPNNFKAYGSGSLSGSQKDGESGCTCAQCPPGGGAGGGPFLP